MNKHVFLIILGLMITIMTDARYQIHEQAEHEVPTVLAAEEVDNVAAQQAALSAQVQVQQSQTPGTIAQIADVQLVSSENEVCTDAARCGGALSASLQTGPITEEVVQFRNYKTYIALWQRVNDGTWKQIGFIANRTIPVSKLEDHGFLDVTVLPDGKAEVVHGARTAVLDFTKAVK